MTLRAPLDRPLDTALTGVGVQLYDHLEQGGVPPRLQARPGGHRVEAQGLIPPLRPLARLAQDEEPGGAGGEGEAEEDWEC